MDTFTKRKWLKYFLLAILALCLLASFQNNRSVDLVKDEPYTNVADFFNRAQQSTVVYEKFKNKIEREKYDINCKALFEDDDNERSKAIQLILDLKGGNENNSISLLPDANFVFDKSMCRLYREIRGYDNHIVTDFEESFPLAYIIMLNEEVEEFERFLRTIYRPHNVYCIHVDQKSAAAVKQAIQSISDCFDNIFITTKIESVLWGDITLLRAQLNCMSDLLILDKLINEEKHPKLLGKKVVEWMYLLNTASSFLPLRTNLELTKIFTLYNGSSDVAIERGTSTERWKYIHEHNSTIKMPQNTWRNKTAPPHDFEIVKGSNYIAASRVFVDYIINSQYGKDVAKWGQDMVVFNQFEFI
jgi:hypothetical protein